MSQQDESSAQPSTTVRVPQLHHVTLKTRRLDEMIRWYGLTIGARVNFRWEGGAFLTVDRANHRIAFIAIPTLVEPADRAGHIGMHHTAFEYGHLDDLLHTFERLSSAGVEPHIALDHGLTTSFYYADPDGNSLELQVDNFDDWDASTAFIRDDPRFAADPVGKLVDPAAMVAARRGGMSVQELRERAYAGEFPPSGPADMRVPLPA
jgi:catechol 2,3-dioxygenase